VTEELLVKLASEGLPDMIRGYAVDLITEIYNQSSATLISVTVIATIWSASKGFLAMIRGFNSVYGIYETRGYFFLRMIASGYTIVFALAIVLTLVLLVFGNRLMTALAALLPPLIPAIPLIISLRVIVSLLILFCFFWVMYVFVPDRKSSFLAELPGALVSCIGWAGFSYLYSYYIDNFANFNAYGSLTTIVLLMLWLYICMYIIFIGSEVNVAFQDWLHQ
jgi:membrane protein